MNNLEVVSQHPLDEKLRRRLWLMELRYSFLVLDEKEAYEGTSEKRRKYCFGSEHSMTLVTGG